MGRAKGSPAAWPDAAKDGFDGPVAFRVIRVREEDFPGAANFGAIVPALEQGEMALTDGCRRGLAGLSQGGEGGFEAGFEQAAGELGWVVSWRFRSG